MSAAPLQIADAQALTWDDEADVVVVGFGGAGVATALQASECGASVIAVDRFEGGGATAYSGGVMYAGGTRYQRENGFADTPEQMFNYLEAEGSAVPLDTLRRFCETSNDDIEWVDGHGVPHGGNAFLEKTAFPPDNHWLYYSGNEKMPAFAARAVPAPRGHRVAINGFGGHLHFAKLREAALARGVTLWTHAPVQRLVVDAAGTVLGVEVNALPEVLHPRHQSLYKTVSPWRPFNNDRAEKAIAAAAAVERGVSRPKLIRARRGVVLSTGGFIYNLEMLAEHRPLLAQNYRELLRLGSMGDDGSGMMLGQSVGGVTALMDNVCVARTLVPPNVFAHGIIVNLAGRRFINEGAYAVVVGGALLEQPGGGKAWLLLESKDFWKGVWKSFFPGGNFWLWGAPALLNIFLGGTRRAGTLAKLAKKIGVDPQGLAATVAAFNAIATDGRPDPLGKAQDLVHPLKAGAFYAVNMSLDNKFAPAQAFTMGGLDIDQTNGAVKRGDGSTIAGLYAAGRVAVGLCSGGYVSGLSIADTVFGGRRAGRAASGSNRADLSGAGSPVPVTDLHGDPIR
ncbi:FAD-binding protein [soil metagenome]